MQHPVDLDLVLLGLDLLHGVDDVAAPFDGGDLGRGPCRADRAERAAQNRGTRGRQGLPARKSIYHDLP